MEVKKTKIKDLLVGTRFIWKGHSSLMIATDMTMNSYNTKKRLCVSENGLCEWLDANIYVIRFNKSIQYKFSGLSQDIVKQYIDHINAVDAQSKYKIKMSDNLGSDIVKQMLSTKLWNILRTYVDYHMVNEDTCDAESMTLGQIAEHYDSEQFMKFRGCGLTMASKVTVMFKTADKNSQQPST